MLIKTNNLWWKMKNIQWEGNKCRTLTVSERLTSNCKDFPIIFQRISFIDKMKSAICEICWGTTWFWRIYIWRDICRACELDGLMMRPIIKTTIRQCHSLYLSLSLSGWVYIIIIALFCLSISIWWRNPASVWHGLNESGLWGKGGASSDHSHINIRPISLCSGKI